MFAASNVLFNFVSVKKLILSVICCFAVLGAVAGVYPPAGVPNVQLSDSTRFVSDPDCILDPEVKGSIDGMLLRLRRETSAEVVLVALDDIESPDDADDFATELFNRWGLGQTDRNNGVLVLFVGDQRKIVIRTGNGVDGALTDAQAGRIIRNVMLPYFREGDYGEGLSEGMEAICSVLRNPDNADVVVSGKNTRNGLEEDDDFFNFYLKLGIIALVVMTVIVLLSILSVRSKPRVLQYDALRKLMLPFVVATFLFLFIPAPALLLLWLRIRWVRLANHKCSVCGSKMYRVGEDADNAYLSDGQDLEEKLNSVDYDVWLCPHCNTREVIPYINPTSRYSECPRCHTRARVMVSDNVLKQPTTLRHGTGVKRYACRHCGNIDEENYYIPKLAAGVVAAAPFRGGNGFGGGGFGGGGFGGGSSMGGGASGGW